jgi:hypothetical protein
MRAQKPLNGHKLTFWDVHTLPDGNFVDAFNEQSETYQQAALGSGPWKLEPAELLVLRNKIIAGKRTLKEVFGSPLYGIKTGLNEAFVIDQSIKDKICLRDSSSAELLVPLLQGTDIQRWHPDFQGTWLIYIPKNKIDIDRYPAIRDWLLPFKDRLESRATKQEWFELQQAQEAYFKYLSHPKIFYAHFNRGYFCRLDDMYACNDKGYFIPTKSDFLLALLTSKVIWFILSNLAPQVIGGSREVRVQYVETLPIPCASPADEVTLGELAKAAQTAAKKRYQLQQEISRRIPDLAADPASVKLSTALKEWWTLPDFSAFQREVKKGLKAEIPLRERNEWENWITTSRAEIHALTAEIARLEAEINAKVYVLFDMTQDEIALLEANV